MHFESIQQFSFITFFWRADPFFLSKILFFLNVAREIYFSKLSRVSFFKKSWMTDED